MSGEFPSSPRAPGRINRPNPRGLVVLLGTSAVVALIVVGICLASTGLTTGRSEASVLSLRSSSLPPAAAPFSVVNLTANNTTVDVSMAFNVSVDVVNLTGGALNASNFTFVWAGLPVFVPGTPGSGCYGLNPDNNSPVLNCTAASPGALSVSVTATNYTSSQSNVSTSLSIQVNVLPTESAFTVSTSGIAATDHVSVAVNASISFSVTASGGTAPLSYSYSGLPLGCSSTAASFSCMPNRAGIYNVTATATDGNGYSTGEMNVTVTVTAPKTTTTSAGIGTTGWGIVIGILVVGALVTVALLVQARREERRGRMGMEEATQQSSSESGGSPPMGGSPPSGPPS